MGSRAVGQALTAAIADGVEWLVDGEEIVPGLQALDAPGHACGQMALLLEDALLIGGDFATHEVVQLAEPDSHMVVEYDGARAVASRRRLLRRAAAEGLLVHAFHFTRPGIGRVTEQGGGWGFT